MCPMFADQKANNRQDLLTREKPKNRHPRRDIWEARDWSYMPPTGLMIKQKNCHHSYSLWDSTGDFFCANPWLKLASCNERMTRSLFADRAFVISNHNCRTLEPFPTLPRPHFSGCLMSSGSKVNGIKSVDTKRTVFNYPWPFKPWHPID